MLEHIVFEVEEGGVGGLKACVFRRELLHALHVGVDLEVEAALELGTLSGELLGIERYILIAGGCCAHGDKVCHPAGAAEGSATRAYAANASGFLACAYLLHLDPHLEGVGEDFDELPEVDALVGNVVENGFVAIALILNITNLHVELEVFGYAACAHHGVVLAGASLGIFVEVAWLCNTEDALELGGGFHTGASHLQLYELAGESDAADVVARSGFHCHHVAYREVDAGGVAVEALTGVFKYHLNERTLGHGAGNVGKPIVAVELTSGEAPRASLAT